MDSKHGVKTSDRTWQKVGKTENKSILFCLTSALPSMKYHTSNFTTNCTTTQCVTQQCDVCIENRLQQVVMVGACLQ